MHRITISDSVAKEITAAAFRLAKRRHSRYLADCGHNFSHLVTANIFLTIHGRHYGTDGLLLATTYTKRLILNNLVKIKHQQYNNFNNGVEWTHRGRHSHSQ